MSHELLDGEATERTARIHPSPRRKGGVKGLKVGVLGVLPGRGA